MNLKNKIAYLFLLIAFSCKKVNSVDYPQVIGKYEWIYTQTDYTSFLTNFESKDKFGLYITKNHKIILYKNGKKINTYKITKFNDDYYNTNLWITFGKLFTKEENLYSAIYKDDIIRIETFPFTNNENDMVPVLNNYFKRK